MSVTSKVYRSFLTGNQYKKVLASPISDNKSTSQLTSVGSFTSENNFLPPLCPSNKQKLLKTQPNTPIHKQSIENKLDQEKLKSFQPLLVLNFDTEIVSQTILKPEEIAKINFKDSSGVKPFKLSGIDPFFETRQAHFSNNKQDQSFKCGYYTLRQNHSLQRQKKSSADFQSLNKITIPSTPLTPRQQISKSFNRLCFSQTKSPQLIQTVNKNIDFPQNKSVAQTQIIRGTGIVSELTKQLNQRQHRISDLQDTVSVLKNNAHSVTAEHLRQIKQKQRQNIQLKQINSKLQLRIKQLIQQNSQLGSILLQKSMQHQTLQQYHEQLSLETRQLLREKECFQTTIANLNSILKNQIDANIFQQLKNDLNQKQNQIIELNKQNQSLLSQMQRIRQQNNSNNLAYSLPRDDLNIYEQVFKAYLQDSQKYKTRIQQKNIEIEHLKSEYNRIRIQNEHLKNQIRVEQFRRVTELRNNDTIMDIQRQSLMNQLKDARYELSVSKQRTKSLKAEIKNKDQFINRNIKPVK